LIGKEVRVYREMGMQRYFGQTGKVTVHKKGYVTVALESEHFEFARQIPEEAVIELTGDEKKPLPRKAVQGLTHQMKDIVLQIVTGPIEKMAADPNQWISQNVMLLGNEYLQWQFQGEPDQEPIRPDRIVRTLDPNETHIVIKEKEKFSQDERDEVVKNWQEHIKGAHKVLAPIVHSDHWTLLVIEEPGKEHQQVRYYDTLTTPSEACATAALEVLALVSGKTMEETTLPTRWNRWKQPPETGCCGIAVLHYMEEEYRDSRGEGLGQNIVNTKDFTKKMESFISTLAKRRRQLEDAEKTKEPLKPDAGGLEAMEFNLKNAKARAEEHWAKVLKGAKSVPNEYRCSRCRYSKGGTGCASINCNPNKYYEYMKKTLHEGKFVAEGTKTPEEIQALIAETKKKLGIDQGDEKKGDVKGGGGP